MLANRSLAQQDVSKLWAQFPKIPLKKYVKPPYFVLSPHFEKFPYKFSLVYLKGWSESYTSFADSSASTGNISKQGEREP